MAWPARRWRHGAFVAALSLLGACSDLGPAPDPNHGLPDTLPDRPSFDGDVQPIFTRRCALGGCHTPATRQGGLDLSPGAAYASLVNAPAILARGRVRVVPGRPDSSWLADMLSDDPARRHGLPRMPLASTPLTTNQLSTITRWIEQGAARP